MTDEVKRIAEALARPFPQADLEWLVVATKGEGSCQGLAAPYVDARAIQQRLDEVLGIDGWQTRYIEMAGGLACELTIRIPGAEGAAPCWITKTDGAGGGDFEKVKGAFSGALKRAAVMFGVGRYLYGAPKLWTKVRKMGKRTEIEEVPQLPDEFLPENERGGRAAGRSDAATLGGAKGNGTSNREGREGREGRQGGVNGNEGQQRPDGNRQGRQDRGENDNDDGGTRMMTPAQHALMQKLADKAGISLEVFTRRYGAMEQITLQRASEIIGELKKSKS